MTDKVSQSGWYLLSASMILLCASCGSLHRALFADRRAADGQRTSPGRTASTSGSTAAESDGASGALVMHFKVLRVELPMNEVKHSLKIWNHIDESIGDPGLTALLARNGLRLGVADGDAWPAIRTILDENGGRSASAEHIARNGQPLIIELGPVEEGGTYFLHRRGGGLRGGTFADGTRQFRIDYALDPHEPSRVLLRILPEQRQKRIKTRLVEQRGEIVSIRDHEGVSFDELTVTVPIDPGQFLVVGGSAEANVGRLVGSWWLTSELDMQDRETVLCITPQPFRVE